MESVAELGRALEAVGRDDGDSSARNVEDVFASVRCDSSLESKKKVLLIEALEEAIHSQTGRKASATEMFAGMMTTLGESTHHRSELLALCQVVIPWVSFKVLRNKFDLVLQVLESCLTSTETATMTHALRCLAMILERQEPSEASWRRPTKTRAVFTLLDASTATKPKARRIARDCLDELTRIQAAVRKMVIKWIHGELRAIDERSFYVVQLAARLDAGDTTPRLLELLEARDDPQFSACILQALPALTNQPAVIMDALFSSKTYYRSKEEWARCTTHFVTKSRVRLTDAQASMIVKCGDLELLKAAVGKSKAVNDAVLRGNHVELLNDPDVFDRFAAVSDPASAIRLLLSANDDNLVRLLPFLQLAAKRLGGPAFLRSAWHPKRAKAISKIAIEQCDGFLLDDFLSVVLPVAVEAFRKGDKQTCQAAWALGPPTCATAHDVTEVLPRFESTLKAAVESAEKSILRVVCDCIEKLSVNQHMGTTPRERLARTLLPTCFAAALDGRDVVSAVAALAPLAELKFAKSLFAKVIKRLLNQMKSKRRRSEEESDEEAVAILCELAAAVVGRGDEEREILWRAVKPMLLNSKFATTHLEKKVYSAVSALCSAPTSFDLDLVETIAVCPARVPARAARLRCMRSLVETRGPTVVKPLVAEATLCIKDANAKARKAAFEVLDAMATAMRDNMLSDFVQMLIAGLASRTPHGRSAALAALARVVYTCKELPNVTNLLQAAVLLLRGDKAREVAKAALALVAVLLRRIDDDHSLTPLLPDLARALVVWAPEKKARFRVKVKLLLRKLCRRFGYDAIKQYVPEADTPLVAHLRKVDQRVAKKRKAALAHEADAELKEDNDDSTYFKNFVDDTSADEDDEKEQDVDDDDDDLENVKLQEDGLIIVSSEVDIPKAVEPAQKAKMVKLRRPRHLKGKQAAAAKRKTKLKGDATKPGQLQPYVWKPLGEIVRTKKRKLQ